MWDPIPARACLRSGSAPAGLLLILFLVPLPTECGGFLAAQELATVLVEENLRAEPQGVAVGRLSAGAAFPVLEVDGRWVRVEVEGWIWTPSTRSTDRPGFDLEVSASPQENLRAEPRGAIIARLLEGALLERVEEVPGWTLVRRVAWVWGPSVDLGSAPPSPVSSESGRPSSPRGSDAWWRSGPMGAPILSAPDGDTLARATPNTQLQVLAREGNWVRVRLEGWSWAPEGEGRDTLGLPAVSDASPEAVSQDPDAYRGSVVSWDLQFVSLERAEKVRTDFYEGEPFLLTRSSGSGTGFVYVAVPPERVGEVDGLIPLERIRVVGRIRTGSAALTGNPILDLLELTRISRR